MARERQPDAWTPPPAISEQIQQQFSPRDDLLAMKNEETNRLHALQHHPRAERSVMDRLEQHIAYWQAEIDAVLAELHIRSEFPPETRWSTITPLFQPIG